MKRPFTFKKRQDLRNLHSPCHNIIRTLSKLGVCSRKQACEWVLAGRVQIKGRIIRDPGFKVRSGESILLDGKPALKKNKIYLMLHKPAGYITSRQDEKGRKTVYGLLREIPEWIFPVGRLDQDSEGLLLFTNDTAWGEKLTNPASQIARTYRVVVDGVPSPEDLQKIQTGMDIGKGEHSQPASVKLLYSNLSSSALEMTLTEGKNREVRRIFEKLGKQVRSLLRTRFGPFRLDGLPPGRHRRINPRWELF